MATFRIQYTLRTIRLLIACGLLLVSPALVTGTPQKTGDVKQTVQRLSASGDRSTGTPGCAAAAAHIENRFRQAGADVVGTQAFLLPVRQAADSTLASADGATLRVYPLLVNAVATETALPEEHEGHLIYAGNGHLSAFNGLRTDGAIVLMDIDSGGNWINAANLGARALIYVDRGVRRRDGITDTPGIFFADKQELTPVRFPRFWVSGAALDAFLGQPPDNPLPAKRSRGRLTATVSWRHHDATNVYALIEGTDPAMKDELVVVTAFYDSSSMVAGRSPGADEAVGIATLLQLAEILNQRRPGRSVLLTATAGHNQGLAGMREMVWSVRVRSQYLNRQKKELNAEQQTAAGHLAALDRLETDGTIAAGLKAAVETAAKNRIDAISRRLMQLRLAVEKAVHQKDVQQLTAQRATYQRLLWREDLAGLSPVEQDSLRELAADARQHYRLLLKELSRQEQITKQSLRFRKLVKEKDPVAFISLHLSSRGDAIGAFNRGWQYALKPAINRVSAYSGIDEALADCAKNIAADGELPLLRDTLRPNRRQSWQSYLADRPALEGEVSSLAGFVGISLVTLNDARPFWGTPNDTIASVNWDYAARQADYVCRLISRLTHSPRLRSGDPPRDGFSTVNGSAKFLRHGELFADQPAPGTLIMAFQGPQRYYAMTDTRGGFVLKGLADKKHMLDKVIIEGYRLDPNTGHVVWAIDKKRTGKSAYRLKMNRPYMQTDLIMFACRQTTLFDLLEPRNFAPLTKIQLIDGQREAPPLTYWYSRIDTRESILASVFLEPNTRLKMTLSDSVLRKKMVLTNAATGVPNGAGYRIDQWPTIPHTAFRVAGDMWSLLTPRVKNLETRGINDQRIRELQVDGEQALEQARKSLEKQNYGRFSEAATKSWALASRVYDQVDKTQKDVLFGVLFYIALFVPFAFCLERLVFAYTDINKRIGAFLIILLALIAVIYQVHPAFQLSYSPLVVILAFFIIGLSFLVSLIIFFRFEDEMSVLQRRAEHIRLLEIGRGKAFMAAFFLGVSNLRRRPLRTALTCTTLVILTFTVMSFTTVKTQRRHARVGFQPQAPYHGLLFKHMDWKSLPPQAAEVMINAFARRGTVAPRAWLEAAEPTEAPRLQIGRGSRRFDARGIIGMSANEPLVAGVEKTLVGGRWLREDERQAVLLSDRMAQALGIDPRKPEDTAVEILGQTYDVAGVFSSERFGALADLDGEPLTPATFPREVITEMTEAEMEALESGDDVQSFQSRYQHTAADLTLVLPLPTVLAAGGQLKSIAVRLKSGLDIRKTAYQMVDRFGLSLFGGEAEGTFVYQASDTLNYSGVPNIIVPLIISVFIVLNTMISSVYERKREIAVYTSVGLAPLHVSFLFIAEALAFAVLSVVIGYVVAQVSASLLAHTSLWSGVTVNYSSLSGVAAMILVLLVVLISVIYPSRIAASIAIPDVNRAWTMPASQADTISITLPFLIKYEELFGIGGYLYTYFKAHQDVSHGVFSTGDVGVTFQCPLPKVARTCNGNCSATDCREEVCLRLNQKVWLAPFDFGIMQHVDLSCCPAADNPEFLEIRLVLQRKSGEVNAWWRINKVFINQLRKQLLIWRALDVKSQKQYAEELS